MLIFLFMPDVDGAYWILTAMNAQLYLVMYIIMFLSAIVLRVKQPDTNRPFKIGGGRLGILIVVTVAVLGALFTLLVGFFPPSQIKTGNIWFFELFLIIGMMVMTAVPLVIYALRKSLWATGVNE